jgi:8-oxo-dGTP diphosphatase
LYHKKSEEDQQKTERGLNLLNLLFGAGILADLAGVIMLTLNLQEGSLFTFILNGLIGIIIITILAVTIIYYIYIRLQLNKPTVGLTVDAVIEDQKGNVVLIKRKYPPFQNYYALPGGFIKEGEKPMEAVIREVKEETNLDIKIDYKIGVYTEEGRDPRGSVHTTAYKCSIVGDFSKIRGGDDSKTAELIPISELKNIELAFDHKKILNDGNLSK